MTKSIIVREPSPEALISQGIKNGISVETMEKLLAMRRELKAERAKEAYHRSMTEFQAECPIIRKSEPVMNKPEKGGGKRYAFAPLDSIIAQVRPLIEKHGFSYKIDAIVEPTWVTAVCKITHEMGYSESSEFKVPVDMEAYMTQPQKFASALTFAKRYAFCDAFGIMTQDKDDDAGKAEKGTSKEYEAIAGMIKKMSKANLKECKTKLLDPKSKKYSQEQKNQLIGMIDKRIVEIAEIESKEKKA